MPSWHRICRRSTPRRAREQQMATNTEESIINSDVRPFEEINENRLG
jgi:hypothetical protein